MKTLDEILDKFTSLENKKLLDEALELLPPECLAEFEEALELWKTYGGD